MFASCRTLCALILLFTASAEAADDVFGHVPFSLSMSAGQSFRRNTGNTAFEAVTPITTVSTSSNPNDLFINSSGIPTNGIWVSLSAVLDGFGSSQGSILYRDVLSWDALNPGTAGQFLMTNGPGANPSWATVSGGGTPGGSNTQVQFNDGGAFGGDSGLTYDKTANDLTINDGHFTDILTDNNTNTLIDVASVSHNSTAAGTPAPGLGSALVFKGESSTTDNQIIGRIGGYWKTATHASRSGVVTLQPNSAASGYNTNAFVLYADGCLSVGDATDHGANIIQAAGGFRTEADTSPSAGLFLLSDGSVYKHSAYQLPTSVSTSGKMMQSNGANIVMSTPTYPATAGASGNVLTSNGTDWTSAAPSGGGGTPGGSNTQVQFNDSGAFGGDADFTWNKTTNLLTINGSAVAVQDDAANNAAIFPITVRHTTTGTAAVGMGVGISYETENSGGSNSIQGRDVFALSATGPDSSSRTFQLNAGGSVVNAMTLYSSKGLDVGTGSPTDPGNGIINAFNGYKVGATTATNGTILRGDGTSFKATTFTVAAPGTSGNVLTSDGTNWLSSPDTGGGGGAGTGLSYITKVAEGTLSNEFALASLATGLLKNTTTTGVPTIAVAKTDYWDTTDFVASGASHAHGLVPDPGSSAGTARFLREDATWVDPSTQATAPLTLTISDAATTTTPAPLIVSHKSSGTPAANFGTEIQFVADDATVDDKKVGEISAFWTTATDLSRASSFVIRANTGGGDPQTVARFSGAGGLSVGAATTVDPLNGIINALNGYRVNNTAATSGKILQGDGTNLVMSTPTWPTSISQGDILYGSATSTVTALAKDTNSTRYLSNTGSTNNPAWAQVAVSTGISGFGTGVATALGTATNAAGGFSPIDGTATLTNKRITKRVDDQNAPSSPYTINSDSFDGATFRGINAALTLNAPSGTPTSLQPLMLRFKDDGTGRALTFTTGANGFRAVCVAFPTTTVANKTTYILFVANVTDSRWDSMATGTEP